MSFFTHKIGANEESEVFQECDPKERIPFLIVSEKRNRSDEYLITLTKVETVRSICDDGSHNGSMIYINSRLLFPGYDLVSPAW